MRAEMDRNRWGRGGVCVLADHYHSDIQVYLGDKMSAFFQKQCHACPQFCSLAPFSFNGAKLQYHTPHMDTLPAYWWVGAALNVTLWG